MKNMLKIFERLRRFDAYAKTVEDVRIKTYTGAIVTLISLCLIFLLVSIEIKNLVTPDVSEELFVDTSRSPDIQINLDIVVPKISCDFLALDAMDASGEQHLQIDHNIYKRKLNLDGEPIEEAIKEDITITTKNATEESEKNTAKNDTVICGSCYGAADRCCNSCEDVRAAYREKRWAFPDSAENIVQCKDDKFQEKLKVAFSQGCQIYGTLIVNRVSGSFHIAPGKSFSINHVHVHDVQPFTSTEFNMTHRIRHLSFGPEIDKFTHNPLKDTEGVANEEATMFQYHIKIVPTSYTNVDRSVIHSNQFSVTKHQKRISIMSGENGMPGIFFQYELSPLMVKYTINEPNVGHFLTNICAIIGGVYTVAGLIDAILYHSMSFRIDLGKMK